MNINSNVAIAVCRACFLLERQGFFSYSSRYKKNHPPILVGFSGISERLVTRNQVELAVMQVYPNTSKEAEIIGLYWDSVITYCLPAIFRRSLSSNILPILF